jgi:hypothetical protein
MNKQRIFLISVMVVMLAFGGIAAAKEPLLLVKASTAGTEKNLKSEPIPG